MPCQATDDKGDHPEVGSRMDFPMTIAPRIRRQLGTMIVHGFPKANLEVDLAIAGRLGATVLEILPFWKGFPDPVPLRERTEALGLRIWSAHGCWGGQSIRADRVDLANPNAATWSASVDDLKRCVDWLKTAGGSCLVIHPGGLSDRDDLATRREALLRGLVTLADHARGTGVTLCVENMPPGVFPGSRMSDLCELVEEIDRPEVALALDTGHAHLSVSVSSETEATGTRLRTTHVHDNDGRQDAHLPPGLGSIDWAGWIEALDAIDYRGPIVLECIKYLRDRPESLTPDFLGRLRLMTGLDG
jgi:sugar phosphate isomerase/epimerase